MTVHAENKALIEAFLGELAEADGATGQVLRRYCAKDSVWEVFHPFNTLHGVEEVERELWASLKRAFPDHEHRLGVLIGGEYEGRSWVSTLGYVMGSFEQPWLGIPPTQGLAYLRTGMNFLVEDGFIVKAYIMFDIVDLMRQAGYYPFRSMPGTAEQWPFPPVSAAGKVNEHDADLGAETLRIVREMHLGLGSGASLQDHAATVEHSPHWHKNMNWYGIAGIGSSRGQRGFDDYHGALFIQAFPDREGIVRDHSGPLEGPGHYIRIGDGRFAITGGWPSLYATHTGPGWLGMPPTGHRIEMRVADWYRTDEHSLIIDNWVMIDVLHILKQIGYDVLEDTKYLVDPMLPRWPRPPAPHTAAVGNTRV
ncbi:hypothetical protein QEH68_21135 [Paenarthrobacter sp. OM7]|uniref:Polyketide cyclase n=1 Tax=Paenarthrobacter sp. AMU7 TaxID=3162492 RepID=A0AB39YNU5_9MICC|nr:hypothetical protein [Paenarthrobacter sp. OM7]WGM20487.1 hypothetical protein QEH68_21135 [Paenarthrobacter sp. OM7]